MLRFTFAATVLWLATQSHWASANPAPIPAERDATVKERHSGPATPSDPSSEGDELFAEAQALYDAGDLRGALAKMEECYALTHAVNLLYNMGIVHRELRDCPKALDYFQRYAAQSTEDEQRQNANRQIAELSVQCPPPKPDKSQPLPPVQAPAPNTGITPPTQVHFDVAKTPPRTASTAGWVTVGAGAVSGVAAIYFAKEAFQAKQDAESAAGSREFEEHSSQLTRDSTIAWTLGATSVVAIGLGTYLLARPPSKEPRTAVLGFTATYKTKTALVGWRLRF